MIAFFKQLFLQTIYEPAEAARVIRANLLPREGLWTALALGCILNTLVYFITTLLFPAPQAMPLLESPGVVFVMLLSVSVITIFALYWVGLRMGGAATMDDVIGMVAWLQYMRVAVQLAALALMIFMPALAALLVMAASIYGIWIMVNFMKVAHEFDSLGQAFMLLVLTAVAIFAGLMVFLALFGVALTGL